VFVGVWSRVKHRPGAPEALAAEAAEMKAENSYRVGENVRCFLTHTYQTQVYNLNVLLRILIDLVVVEL
jgi:hypothetical protein